jgi:hypothetical protein
MTILGKYCRAYPLSRLRRFPGWTERAENARRIKKELDGETVEVARELTDADYVYLHGNFTVTDGIFIDENIIFSDVTPEWIEFCRNVLGHDSPASWPKQRGEDSEPGD